MQNDAVFDSARPANNNGIGALFLLICAAWILPGLWSHDPWKPDEAYTFGLVHQLLQGGSWIVPTLAGEPYVDKPPLFILTAAAFANLTSFLFAPHDGARLAAGFYMAVALAFIAATGRELYGARRGRISALLVLGCFGLVVRAHQLIADTALFAGTALGCYGLALMLRRPALGGSVFGTGVGVAFMAKGLIGPLILTFAAVVLIATCSAWRRRSSLGAMGLGTLAATPWLVVWPLSLYLTSPDLFGEWLWGNVYRVVGSEGGLPRMPQLGYLAILPWYAWPALPLALWVLWGTRVSRFARPQIQLPVVLFASCLFLLSIPGEPRELHAMPMLIPLGLLATTAVDNMRRGASNAMYWFGIMGFTFFAAVAWFYWVALELGVPTRLSTHLHKLQPAYDSHVRPVALTIGLAYTTGWIVLVAKLKPSVERPVVIWAAGMTLIWGLLMSLFIDYADASKSYRSTLATMTKALPSTFDCIGSRALGESQRALLHYHAGILTHREEAAGGPKSCELLLVQGQRAAPPEIPPGWHQVWEGTRPGEKEEYFWLYGYGPPPPVQ